VSIRPNGASIVIGETYRFKVRSVQIFQKLRR
jgi:hypothetical protein